jgi:hypothetical protein
MITLNSLIENIVSLISDKTNVSVISKDIANVYKCMFDKFIFVKYSIVELDDKEFQVVDIDLVNSFVFLKNISEYKLTINEIYSLKNKYPFYRSESWASLINYLAAIDSNQITRFKKYPLFFLDANYYNAIDKNLNYYNYPDVKIYIITKNDLSALQDNVSTILMPLYKSFLKELKKSYYIVKHINNQILHSIKIYPFSYYSQMEKSEVPDTVDILEISFDELNIKKINSCINS